MSIRRLPRQLVMTRKDFAVVLHRVAGRNSPASQELYTTLTGLWGARPDRRYITFIPTAKQRAVLRAVPLPANVVQSRCRYVAVYRCDRRPELEVTTRTIDRPPRKRKFKVAGGSRRFTLVSLYQVKESKRMAKGKAATKAKKADPIDELEEELEGLEEVDLEDEEPDAPDVEEDDDDEEDDDSPDSSWSAKKLKEYCKAKGYKGISQANKTKLLAIIAENEAEDDEEDDEEEDDPLADLDRTALKALLKEHGLPNAKKSESDDDLRDRIRPELPEDEEEPEEEDEEEDDEEEEDDDPLDGLSRAELKAYNKEHELGVRVTKSMSDDDLRAAMRVEMGDEVEEDEEEDEPAPKKGKGKSTGKGKGKQPNQLIRKLPAGKLGAEDIAKMAGTNGLAIRNFLRKDENKKKFPKNAELNRYAFTEKQAKNIVAAYKKGARGTTK